MAEIRVNATGGLKLYDADDSHYAQIVAGTITSNVDAITLGHDTVTIADNLSLGSDSAVLKFGADGDTTLTHTDGTGLTLNSTNKICFNDASQFIQGSSNAVLSLGATDEIDLTATAVDLNGTLNVSGVATFQATPVFPDGSLALADLDIDGGTDIGAALVDADEIIVDDGGGGTNRRCDMSRIKTYIGTPISVAENWRVNTSFTGDADPIASNWEINDTDKPGTIGGGVISESSGVFSFDRIGIYLITFQMTHQLASGGDDAFINAQIQVSADNGSSWSSGSECSTSINNSAGTTAYAGTTQAYILDVSAVSGGGTVKVRFKVGTANDSTTHLNYSATSNTGVNFIRLGDAA